MLAASADNCLNIRFWGVRGSVPTPGEAYNNTGGNTPCIVLQYADEPVVIIDAGTGIRLFGQSLAATEKGFEATLLLSHFHWDHIQGFPYFAPAYSKNTNLQTWSGVPACKVKQNLSSQMVEPFFPVSFDKLPAHCMFHQINESGFSAGSLQVTPVTLNHPGSATGFRINSAAGSIIYVSDHEHGVSDIDRQIEEKAQGANLMIYDAHFTPEEYPSFRGWGHSTWEEGCRMAARAGVQKLVLFHHSPARTDTQVASLVAQAQNAFPKTIAADEREAIVLRPTL